MTIPQLKKAIWKQMSLFVRRRDTTSVGYGFCCSCGKCVYWNRADAGHFIARGMGGRSGVYFDERNVNIQCKTCNAFKQGNPAGYESFMLLKHGQKVIDELRLKDKINRYSRMELEGLLLYYKEKAKEVALGR